MLTQTELEQIKVALYMLNPEETIGNAKPIIIDLLKTFTQEESKTPWNGMYGPNSHQRYVPGAAVLLRNDKKPLIEDTPLEGGSLC